MKHLLLLPFLAISLNAHAETLRFECTGNGQSAHGLPYTRVEGQIELKFDTGRMALAVTESTLPPFPADSWGIKSQEVAIYHKSETYHPDGSRSLTVESVHERSQGNERFRDHRLVVSAIFHGDGTIFATATSLTDQDEGDRGVEIVHRQTAYALNCRLQ